MTEEKVYELGFGPDGPEDEPDAPYGCGFGLENTTEEQLTDVDIDALADIPSTDAGIENTENTPPTIWGDVPFDFLDLSPTWTYIPLCGHKVFYKNRLTVNNDESRLVEIARPGRDDSTGWIGRQVPPFTEKGDGYGYNADDADGIRWGYCRECKTSFQVNRKTIEIAPRTCGHKVFYKFGRDNNQVSFKGLQWDYCKKCQAYFNDQTDLSGCRHIPLGHSALAENSLDLLADNAIISNRIAWCLWVASVVAEDAGETVGWTLQDTRKAKGRDEGMGVVSKVAAGEIASEVGQPGKSRMVSDVARHGIVRLYPGPDIPGAAGELDPVLRGRRTHFGEDKGTDTWKKMVDEDSAGSNTAEDTGWESGWDMSGWLGTDHERLRDIFDIIRARGWITCLPRPVHQLGGVRCPPKRPRTSTPDAWSTFWGTEPDVRPVEMRPEPPVKRHDWAKQPATNWVSAVPAGAHTPDTGTYGPLGKTVWADLPPKYGETRPAGLSANWLCVFHRTPRARNNVTIRVVADEQKMNSRPKVA